MSDCKAMCRTSRIVIARRIMEENGKKIAKVVEGGAFQELLHPYQFICHLLSGALLWSTEPGLGMWKAGFCGSGWDRWNSRLRQIEAVCIWVRWRSRNHRTWVYWRQPTVGSSSRIFRLRIGLRGHIRGLRRVEVKAARDLLQK
jgi:hypothetical protein